MIIMGNLHAGGPSDTSGPLVLIHRGFFLKNEKTTPIFIMGIFVVMYTCCTIQMDAIFIYRILLVHFTCVAI